MPVTDERLIELVLEAEDYFWREGHPPKHRQIRVVTRVLKELRITEDLFRGETSQRISAIQRRLYRRKDLAIGWAHAGVFMFRGIAARIAIPRISGSVSINALECTDLTESQLAWLSKDPEQVDRLQSTFIDVLDVAGAIDGFDTSPPLPAPAKGYFTNAGFQLQSAAATICELFDYRGSVQSALLGAELGLKGTLLAAGKSENYLKDKIGHKLDKGVEELVAEYPKANSTALAAAVGGPPKLPNLVPNRYDSAQPSLIEAGDITMRAQFIAAEAVRVTTGHSYGAQKTG